MTRTLPRWLGHPFTLSLCHGCWCPGNTWCQGINSNGIELVLPGYSPLVTKMYTLRTWHCVSVKRINRSELANELWLVCTNPLIHPINTLRLVNTWAPSQYIKTIFPRYGDSHVKDKTVVRLSYLSHGDPYTGKMTSLYWDSPEMPWNIIDIINIHQWTGWVLVQAPTNKQGFTQLDP